MHVASDLGGANKPVMRFEITPLYWLVFSNLL